MKNEKKTSLKEMLIEYAFALIGFFLGMIVTVFVLGLTGMREHHQQLLYLLSEIGGLITAMFVFARGEANRTDARTEFHKALDEGREREELRFGALLRQLRMPYDVLFAILVPVIFVRHGFSPLISEITTMLTVFLLMLAIRLLAIFLARKKWAKEHIKK